MGVGKPADLIGAVARGIDLFDCVLPTRSGRTAQAWTAAGPLNLRNRRHADDPAPLEPGCACPACRDFSRAYLHHLIKAGEILGAMLLTWHNLHYYQSADGRGARRHRGGTLGRARRARGGSAGGCGSEVSAAIGMPGPRQPRRVQLDDADRIPMIPAPRGRVAQLAEQLTFNQRVLGSSPSAPTKKSKS